MLASVGGAGTSLSSQHKVGTQEIAGATAVTIINMLSLSELREFTESQTHGLSNQKQFVDSSQTL